MSLPEITNNNFADVSVVIPNYNGAAMLKGCLDSLQAQLLLPAEVIVVDNGSKDGSRTVVEDHPLKPQWIALSENKGFSAACNLGIVRARSSVVAFLNNDAVADPRWILAGARTMASRPDVDFIASMVLDFNNRDIIESAGAYFPRDARPRHCLAGKRAAGCTRTHRIIAASAAAAFFRKTLFDDVGYFDEKFFAYLEDVDLCIRAQLLGKTGILAPDAVVYHRGQATELGDRPGRVEIGESSLRVKWIARNKINIIARDLPLLLVAVWMPFMLAGLVKSAAYHVFRSGQAEAFFSGTWQGILSTARMAAARRDLHKRRRIGVWELASRMRECGVREG